MKASEYHAANSEEWNIPLEDNDVIIFPSKMYHSVAPNRTDNLRISIAFNSFIRGTIGTDISGADLNLK
jgi:ectoine hydroxylase-related dioxygenase (phytanoyl-CoA dioxygenase family)